MSEAPKDWSEATPDEIAQRRKDVRAAAKLISTSPVFLIEDAETYTADQYGASWGAIHEMVSCFMCRLAEGAGE